ncbi:MAG: hypothetical protein ACR2N2_05125 [Acidimicrobiia bacterium]
MTKLITLIAALAISFWAAPTASPSIESAQAARPEIVEPDLSIHGARRGQAATIEWAVERFAQTGLPLPKLSVHVHSASDGCHGERGLFRGGGSTNRIDMCTDNLFVLLHEIAHAWEVNYATDEARDAYADSLGLEVWRSDDVAWGDQASERAANSVAWGLMPRTLSPSDAAATQDMIERFTVLTGTEVPRVQS